MSIQFDCKKLKETSVFFYFPNLQILGFTSSVDPSVVNPKSSKYKSLNENSHFRDTIKKVPH